MSSVVELNGIEQFEKVSANGLSVIDFWAPWCGPCRMMMPILEEIASEMTNVKFFKVNVDNDENSNIASRFHVISIPCFIVFRDGKVIGTRPGGSSKRDMLEWLNSLISQ